MENTYTLNKLQMFDECPQKYKLCYVDKVHVVEPIAKTRTGNNLHAIINYYLKGMDVTKLVDALTKNEKILWCNFKNAHLAKYKCVASEYAFNLKIAEYWLTGRIDALFSSGEQFIIADWKTGENFKPDNVKFQTAFYLLCIYEILKTKNMLEKPEQLSLHYVNLYTDSVIKIPFDEDLYTQYKTQVLSVINKINETTAFFCSKTENCKSCKYYRVCPFY